MHLIRKAADLLPSLRRSLDGGVLSPDSFQLMKGADAAAIIGAVMCGEHNLGAEDDFGIAGENNLRKREYEFR